MAKKTYDSKTLWFNLILLIVIEAYKYGVMPSPETLVALLALANILLRLVSSDKIVLFGDRAKKDDLTALQASDT